MLCYHDARCRMLMSDSQNVAGSCPVFGLLCMPVFSTSVLLCLRASEVGGFFVEESYQMC
jgi:hypothetical protein